MSLTNINNDNIFKKGVIGNVRKAQEDSHDMKVMTPNGDLFVVCDGMGGHVGGAKASSIAVSSIIEYLNKEKNEGLEDIYWELVGSGDPGEASQLFMIGMMIDKAEINITDSRVEVKMYKAFKDGY